MKIGKDYLKKPAKDPHLHSPAHVLADELSSKLGDPRHFGFYLKTALSVDHNVLRKIMGEVLEKPVRKPGALFAFLVKKHHMENNVSHGCSLWLLPEPGVREQLGNTIRSMAASYGTVAFEPHITLVGGLPLDVAPEMLDKLGSIKAFEIEPAPIEMEDIFFKSFYLPIVRNKSLNAARRMAKKEFAPDSKEIYRPHLALVYGNFKPENKLSMLRMMTSAFPKKILLTEISLVRTEGTTDEFKTLKTVALQPNEPENS
jgi:hypothetical protein